MTLWEDLKENWLETLLFVIPVIVVINLAVPDDPWWYEYVGIFALIFAIRAGIQLDRVQNWR